MARRQTPEKVAPPRDEKGSGRSLVRVGALDAGLTTAQKTFNRLVRRIERLQREVEKENRRLDRLVALYSAEIHPLELQVMEHRRAIIRRLYREFEERIIKDPGARRRLQNLLKTQLLELLGEAGGTLDPEFGACFRAVLRVTPDEWRERENDRMREEVERGFKEMGVDVDLLGMKPGMSPEDLEQKLGEIDQQIRAQLEPEELAEPRRTSRRQQAAEEKRKQMEEMRTRDLAGLYKQLAKILHPDLEQDPARRADKEAAMKRLNTAYAADDLHAMLTLEVEWIRQEGADAALLPDQKLKIYNEVLREQVKELEEMRDSVWTHPRFRPLSRFAHPFLGLAFLDEQTMRQAAHADLHPLEQALQILERQGVANGFKDLVRFLSPAPAPGIPGMFGF